MKFGAHYLPTYVPSLDGPYTEFYRRMFEQIEELDKLGFNHIWVTEHHFGDYGGSIPHPPTFLSAAARSTRRIRLGVAISVLPLHSPLEVAESYAMVDVISNGRLDFGIGKGSEPLEYHRLRVRQEESATRLKEGAEIILQAWSDGEIDFKSDLFEYQGFRVLPKPVQRPHPPIWVGCARSEDTFRWAGENGFNLMTLPYLYKDKDAGMLPALLKVYRQALAVRDPLKQTEVLGKFHIYVSDSLERAIREATPYLNNYRDVHVAGYPDKRHVAFLNPRNVAAQLEEGFVIAGEPERCIDAIHRWCEQVGLTALSGTFHFGGMPQELALKNIRLFADRVMPAFR
jgi:alkanesulfonate monooxygenase SsuD/methylene tetrahydromethanopterin reductase-like flavin-dependent oxidoreductase (luciferase family)